MTPHSDGAHLRGAGRRKNLAPLFCAPVLFLFKFNKFLFFGVHGD